jgi:hypothetical protein
MKIPVQVWKKVRRLQRDFLWGSRGREKKISWMKWDTICKPKHLGGLGVRDIRVVNISLLTKWRWRLLSVDQSMWKKVIIGKYGQSACGKVVIGEENKPWFSSLWWRDVCSIGNNLNTDWFSQYAVKRIGNGRQTSFWKDKWLGDFSLMNKFPRLYSISTQKEGTVAEVWNLAGTVGWILTWRRSLFVWENTLLEELLMLINQTSLSLEEDYWVWRLDKEGLFSVKSTYTAISNMLITGSSVTP